MSEPKIYRLRGKEGDVFLVYQNGLLKVIYNDHKKEFDSSYWEAVRLMIPQNEKSIGLVNGIGEHSFIVTPIKTKTIREKIIAFSAWHLAQRGTSYQPNIKERVDIKNVPVTEALLKAFFEAKEWWNKGNHTMSNYISRINLIKDYAKNGADVKSKYPDSYDPDFERKLEPSELPKYWEHLRNLGYTKVKRGTVSVWVEKQME